MTDASSDDRPAVGRILFMLAVIVALLAGAGYGIVEFLRDDPEPPPPHRQVVRQAFLVESSFFATDPAIVLANLEDIKKRLHTCVDDPRLECSVMTFAVTGADVSARRVPSSHQADTDLGFWVSLDPKADRSRKQAYAAASNKLIDGYIADVAAEIVPDSYESQPRGCVNLIEAFKSAYFDLRSNPGDRNIISTYASGISNCKNQPFYPDHPFPAADVAANAVLAEVPANSAELPNSTVCLEWTQMFGVAFEKYGDPVSNEEKQVLKSAWMSITAGWGAISGNEPGGQPGVCLALKGAS